MILNYIILQLWLPFFFVTGQITQANLLSSPEVRFDESKLLKAFRILLLICDMLMLYNYTNSRICEGNAICLNYRVFRNRSLVMSIYSDMYSYLV